MGIVENRPLIRLGVLLFRRLRQLILGWTPWSVTFFAYRIIRHFPRIYLSLRAVILGELKDVGR